MSGVAGAGLILLAVVVVGTGVALAVRARQRRRAAETPAEKFQRDAADLRYRPQTWRTKRATAARKQNQKRWATGAAGGDVVGGMPGDGDGRSGCGAGGCGGGGCGS